MQVFALIALVPLAAAVPYGAPAYGGYGPSYHKPAYGYKAPKLSCSTVDISETVDVCEPAIENSCEAVQLDIKVVEDNEQCVDVITTVCTETTEVVNREICTSAYQPKSETLPAKNIEVSSTEVCDTVMVTSCDVTGAGYGPSYGHGYGKGYGHGYGNGYGHGYGKGYGGKYEHNVCKKVAQESCYTVPIFEPVKLTVDVTYPEPIETCVTKSISLTKVTCEDLSEQRCINVAEFKDMTQQLDQCAPVQVENVCNHVELSLPQQVCGKKAYGYGAGYGAGAGYSADAGYVAPEAESYQ